MLIELYCSHNTSFYVETTPNQVKMTKDDSNHNAEDLKKRKIKSNFNFFRILKRLNRLAKVKNKT